MVSSLDRLAFSVIISLAMNGFRGRDGQKTVRRGACLSRREDRVEENCETYELREAAGAE
jgi:hypothetical protein